ncbi:MAG: glycosyltransferase, partial [Bacteroidales bacterium]|nr:glycosyltransferase [Bacteroidales bacterium]
HLVVPDELTKCVRYYSSRFFQSWMMVFGYQPAHPSFYCRRECYEKYGTFDISFKIAADFENMLRLIYLNNIRTCYIPMDFVTMRQGGASTNGILSHKNIIMDHYRAYRKNGVLYGYFFDIMRYPLKLGELMLSKTFPWIYGPKLDEH